MLNVAEFSMAWLDAHANETAFNPEPFYGQTHTYLFRGELVPKERPRKGKNGQMYTPPRTREFEKLVSDWGKKNFAAPVGYPVKITLTLFDVTDDPFLIRCGSLGIVYDSHGDLDNYEKAICDALNKVAWRDDKTIVKKDTERMYSDAPGFRLSIKRVGLAAHEFTTLRRIVERAA